MAFADLADWPEDTRIAMIAKTVALGCVVGFIVDDHETADRYCRKLVTYPVRVIDRRPGPITNTVMVRVGPKES